MIDSDFVELEGKAGQGTAGERKGPRTGAPSARPGGPGPIPSGEEDAPIEEDFKELSRRRLAAKLRLLGGNAGYLLLFMLLGLGALAGLGLLPHQDQLLWWATPMAVTVVALAGVWSSRRRQYANPNLTWYLAMLGAVALAGIAWGPFTTVVLAESVDSWTAVAALLILLILLITGTLLLAVDPTLVVVHLAGFSLSTALHVYPLDSPPLQVLWPVGVTCLVLPLLIAWSHRLQRQLVRAAAELQTLGPRYLQLAAEAARVERQLDSQLAHQKQVERELQFAKDEAEGASVAKTEFLATMSHEIRTPLNGIVPILEILRETSLNEEQLEFVTTALNSSHHLLNLINDILDYSKIEAGKLEIESIDLTVEDLVGSVIALMTKSAERRGLRLKQKIADNVPKQVRGDPFRLRQVLTNLVGNAVKFTEKGSVSVEVSRHASSPKEVVLLFAVRDTGIGMSEEATNSLFQVFSQADASTTRKYGGTGLGLVICKRLVEIMGGRIGVKSVQAKGSVFWFAVPMRRTLREVPSSRKSLQGVRVLLAGFDEMDQKRLTSFLGDWGMLHENAATGPDALAKLKGSAKLGKSWGYDVLVVDARTLGSGVTGLVRDIRREFALNDLVVLAVDTFPSVAASLKEVGIGEVVARPVQQQDLRGRLFRLLDVQTYRSGRKPEEERRLLMPDAEYSWEDDRLPELGDDPPSSRTPPREQKSAALSLDTPLQGRVLVVEDNPVNLSVVKKLLQRFEVNCETARDGVEAVEAVRNDRFDLVLMDVQMPNMDGHQATRVIRDREKKQGLPRLPILAMTANAMAGDREKCIDAGMDDYMSKPVRPADLKNALIRWLQSSSSAVEMATEPASGTVVPSMTPSPGGEGMGNNDVLDREILGELFDIMESEATGLLQEYLDNAPNLLGDIANAVKNGKADAMVLPAHSLKSSSANVGAVGVSKLAKRLEFAGRQNNLDSAAADWEKMQQAYAAAERALKDIIARGTL